MSSSYINATGSTGYSLSSRSMTLEGLSVLTPRPFFVRTESLAKWPLRKIIFRSKVTLSYLKVTRWLCKPPLCVFVKTHFIILQKRIELVTSRPHLLCRSWKGSGLTWAGPIFLALFLVHLELVNRRRAKGFVDGPLMRTRIFRWRKFQSPNNPSSPGITSTVGIIGRSQGGTGVDLKPKDPCLSWGQEDE